VSFAPPAVGSSVMAPWVAGASSVLPRVRRLLDRWPVGTGRTIDKWQTLRQESSSRGCRVAEVQNISAANIGAAHMKAPCHLLPQALGPTPHVPPLRMRAEPAPDTWPILSARGPAPLIQVGHW
jgi:hypothetical protein